jgi:hypothetical protein
LLLPQANVHSEHLEGGNVVVGHTDLDVARENDVKLRANVALHRETRKLPRGNCNMLRASRATCCFGSRFDGSAWRKIGTNLATSPYPYRVCRLGVRA